MSPPPPPPAVPAPAAIPPPPPPNAGIARAADLPLSPLPGDTSLDRFSDVEEEIPLDEIAPPEAAKPTPPANQAAGDGGEAALREALSKASKEVIEKIAWEVVPQLAETILREHIERTSKDGGKKGA